MAVLHKWTPISDLPDDWRNLSIPELASLASVWDEQRIQLEESNAVKKFNERLIREWSIETGIIERLYTIDRGITNLLIEKGIDATLIPHGATNRPVSEVVSILNDHREALEGIFAFVASRRELTISYIKQLHQAITRSQEYVNGIDQFGRPTRIKLKHGQWKQFPNNPMRPDGSVHEYCPPLQVQGEMERLIQMFKAHQDVPPEVNAAWLHHRFTQIHPFQDGNGRVARALATIVFLKAGWFPLVINSDQRDEYISALEAADSGELGPLINLFGQIAKRAFVRALTLSEDILSGEKVSTQGGERALTQVIERLPSMYQRHHQTVVVKKYGQVELLADKLIETAKTLLNNVSAQLEEKFSNIPSPPVVRVASSNESNEHYYTRQIITVAQDLGYWANITRRRNWVRLHLVNGQKTQIVFSWHYLGKKNRGVMVCSSFIYFPEAKPDIADSDTDSPQLGETHRICDDPFYFSYQDVNRETDLIERFKKWMSNSLSIGLVEWAQRL